MGIWEKISFLLFLSIFSVFSIFLYSAESSPRPVEITKQEGILLPSKIQLTNFNKYKETLLQKYRTEFNILFNYTQQGILRASENKGKNRRVGYLNFEVKQKLWQGGALFLEFESDNGMGVDKLITTYSQFNNNFGDKIPIYIPELYLEQSLFSDKVLLVVGKLGLSDWFDANNAAESADTQFLSSALVNNLAVPFPAKGLGALISFVPYDWVYFQAGAGTARAISSKTGLSDGFNSTLFINELGFSFKIKELEGNYRLIFYLDHEKLERIDRKGERRDTLGYALSFDQEVTKRIVLFLRYGYADEKIWDIKRFWSFGVEVKEPIPGRKDDYFAVGVARSIMGDDFRSINEDTAARSETIYEIYYSYSLNSFIALTPSLQIIAHPNADKTSKSALVLGCRFLLSF